MVQPVNSQPGVEVPPVSMDPGFFEKVSENLSAVGSRATEAYNSALTNVVELTKTARSYIPTLPTESVKGYYAAADKAVRENTPESATHMYNETLRMGSQYVVPNWKEIAGGLVATAVLAKALQIGYRHIVSGLAEKAKEDAKADHLNKRNLDIVTARGA